jgi:hypothetical protein
MFGNTHEQILENQSITVSALEKNTITVPFHAAAEYLMDDQFVQLFQISL